MKALYRECKACGQPLGPREFPLIGTIKFCCLALWCPTNRPLSDLFAGPPHMTRPNPCGEPNCDCDGRPWWWPGRSPHLDFQQ